MPPLSSRPGMNRKGKMRKADLLIIGGGPTGLGAAICAEEKGLDWHLCEAEEHWGGLSASFKDDQGFTWDIGGHILFSHYGNFDRHMDKALGPQGWVSHERESWIWIRNRFVPYPFQNNLHRLDEAERSGCLAGLDAARAAAAGDGRKPADFERWIDATFGRGISELFMKPYNWKVWAHPLSMMDFAWIGDRVAVPDVEQVLKAVKTGRDNVSWGPNALFRFPLRGGTGAIWSAIAARLPRERVSGSSRVEAIDPTRKTARVVNGEEWQYRNCISTMPLDDLVRSCGDADAIDRLAYTSAHIVGIGFSGAVPAHLKTKCWMYFPERNSPYYRVTVFSNYSPNNVAIPGEQWSLMAEISESGFKKVDGAAVCQDTIRALQEDGLLPDRRAIVSTVARRVKKSYPVPFLGRDALVDPILRRYEAQGLFSRGRFGAWKYEVGNQDHSFQQGCECVERIVNNGGAECEPTLHTPNVVNSRSSN